MNARHILTFETHGQNLLARWDGHEAFPQVHVQKLTLASIPIQNTPANDLESWKMLVDGAVRRVLAVGQDRFIYRRELEQEIRADLSAWGIKPERGNP